MKTSELDQIFNAVYDITSDPAHLSFELRAVIKREVEKAISAAVQAEREACASLAESMKYTHNNENRSGWGRALSIAAAIRARGEE